MTPTRFHFLETLDPFIGNHTSSTRIFQLGQTTVAERLEKATRGHRKATLDGWRQEIGEISVGKNKPAGSGNRNQGVRSDSEAEDYTIKSKECSSFLKGPSPPPHTPTPCSVI